MRVSRTRRLFSVVLLAAILISLGYFQLEHYLHAPMTLSGAEELKVERGRSFVQVIRELTARGVLQKPFMLQIYVRLSARGQHIQAGEYLLGPGTSPLDLLDMLEQGRVRTHALTLVEGWTLTQARALLDHSDFLEHDLKDVPNSQLLAALHVDAADVKNPEGLFFPDTYEFSGSTSDRDILLQAYRRMQKVLDEEWQQRADNLPYKDAYQALIMASIVERETGAAHEREEIAGVFVRRLQRGMLLQTDPAVIYGIAHYDGNLRRRDLLFADNPYNTYMHRGLPPTPIALPGRASIHAALHPDAGDALYFVAKGDGSHQFSATLAEHEKAVLRYQIRHRRTDYRSSPEPESSSSEQRK